MHLTSLNFVTWPDGAETNKELITALRYQYSTKYGNISEIFSELFQHKKIRILYIATHDRKGPSLHSS